MRFFLISFLFLCLSVQAAIPQSLTIIDNEDERPLADVAITDRTGIMVIYSDNEGKADISRYAANEMICFSLFTYEKVCLSYEEIRNKEFIVRLNRKIFAMEEFIVSASKREQSIREVPNRIVVVPGHLNEFQNPQTSADLVAVSDEVFVQKSQLGGGSPMIRGFATNRILIVVDGVRMNNAIYREGNIQNVISLDPSAIESSEIVFGPGSVVYGSDAIGGVLDFRTRKALLATGEKPLVKVNAFSRVSSANKEKTYHLDFSAGKKKAALFSGISWSDYNDLRMGSYKNQSYLRTEYVARINGRDSVIKNPDGRIQIYSGYRQLNTTNKLRLKISDKADLVISNHYSRLSDVPRYDRLIQYKSGKLRYGDWYYGPQIWIMTSADLTFRGNTSLFDQVDVLAAQQNYRESRHDRSFGNSVLNEQTERLSIQSVNIDFDKNLKSNKAFLYYGFEFVNNDISSTADKLNMVTGVKTPAGSRYPNGDNRYTAYSLYAGYKNNLTEKFTFNSGLRYNYVTLDCEIADNSFYNFPFTEISISNGALTGSAGGVLRTSDRMSINFNLSTGFRAPNLDDAGKVFDSAPGVVVVPNPDLKPEYIYTADAGISKDFGKLIHSEVSVFISLLSDAMIRHNFLFNGEDSIFYQGELSKVEAMTNSGSATVYGLSFSLQANLLEKLRLKTSLNLTEGYEKGGIPLRHSTPAFGSVHILYNNSVIEADLYSVFNGPKRYEKMAPSEIEKPYMYASDKNGNPWSPGWITLNFKGSCKIGSLITINAGIENILDIRYRPYSSGIAAPGRNFILSLRLKI